MGAAWLAAGAVDGVSPAARYVDAWRSVGRRPDREAQLGIVMGIGRELAFLTRTPGLRTMLRMMRPAAAAAGLGSLQEFLEAGFQTVGELARQRGELERFLSLIQAREKKLMDQLFDAAQASCEVALAPVYGAAGEAGRV